MILQRLASAIRHQNWSQIITEILIVVIGIFLGFQVTDWNERRGYLEEEQFNLRQLHSEIYSGLELTQSRISYKEITYNNLLDLALVLKGTKNRDELNELYCYALFSSHIYADQPAALPTINELMVGQRLSLIQNDEIRQMISQYSLALDSFDKLIMDILYDRTLMHQKFPDLIKLDPTMLEIEVSEAELLKYDNQCNLDKMIDNTAFTNALVDNLGRLYYFIKFLREIHSLMDKQHVLLDQELGITHDEASP